MAMMKSVLFSLCCLLLGRDAAAWMGFRNKMPNGDMVMRMGEVWPGVGHEAKAGGGPRNVFGLAFKAANNTWTMELCQADTDGDGQTNGFELGDPDCTWMVGGTPARTVAISHPGYADSYVDVSTNTTVVDTTAATDGSLSGATGFYDSFLWPSFVVTMSSFMLTQ
mmetsp:Transcript_15623/g.36568  ORF Transcript_15623/g.36568 Transcript_15623/m.36568 type:complete len:166 (+) Transcript_15623:103-600(+)|eukprot:CAMPEP_0178421218 /NCGR_PEP_ID=MMETSP0689_2-20121128/26535_1 /TAXON_ID=160604 /ORGANISM="Amphidinium massartii, Strain CS-259" /LENGTH=165 /DNA_ID=CAMNT_0020042725 /DNA_START=85 /DNA_END=582 /DNA_ORIENTATION=+